MLAEIMIRRVLLYIPGYVQSVKEIVEGALFPEAGLDHT